MNRPVILTTPIPTLREVADFYGLSKADRKFIDGLFVAEKGKALRGGARKRTASKAGVKNGTGAIAAKRKLATRARKTA